MRTLRSMGRDARDLDIIVSPYTDHVGSIADRAVIRRAMEDVRTVVHTATLHKPHIATYSAEAFIETNVKGMLVLAKPTATGCIRWRRACS